MLSLFFPLHSLMHHGCLVTIIILMIKPTGDCFAHAPVEAPAIIARVLVGLGATRFKTQVKVVCITSQILSWRESVAGVTAGSGHTLR